MRKNYFWNKYWGQTGWYWLKRSVICEKYECFWLIIYFFQLSFFERTRQGICSSVDHVLAIIDSKIVTNKLLGPTDLTKAPTFYIHKAMEVIMICEDENLIFAAF